MGEGQSGRQAGNDRQRSARHSPAAGHHARAGGIVGQQLSLPVAPCCQPSGDPRGRWFQLLTEKDKGPALYSGEGQKVHRAHGGLLTAND